MLLITKNHFKIIFSFLILLNTLISTPVFPQSTNSNYDPSNEIFKTITADEIFEADEPDRIHRGYGDKNSCIRKVNLTPVTYKEQDELGDCLTAEIVKMGYPLCNAECLNGLTQEEINEHFALRAKQFKYLVEKELERRVAEQIKASKSLRLF